jgi:hypothetical protein
MQIKVQDFVPSWRMNCQRVTARQVLDFLVQKKHLIVLIDGEGRYQKVPFKAAYRVVQRWLVEFAGYDQGKHKGNLVPSEANVSKKHHYHWTFFSKEPSLQQRGSERCTRIRKKSTKAVAISSVQPSKDPTL